MQGRFSPSRASVVHKDSVQKCRQPAVSEFLTRFFHKWPLGPSVWSHLLALTPHHFQFQRLKAGTSSSQLHHCAPNCFSSSTFIYFPFKHLITARDIQT